MAKIKFRSKLAATGNAKFEKALIDSDATHHFVHLKKQFLHYGSFINEDVHSASEVSRIVGRETIFLDLDDGVYTESFHTF